MNLIISRPAQACLTAEGVPPVQVAFTVVTQSGEAFRPQQAVVRLTSAQSGAAAYFAATRNKDGSLSTAIKSADVEKQLGSQVGRQRGLAGLVCFRSGPKDQPDTRKRSRLGRPTVTRGTAAVLVCLWLHTRL